MDAVPVMREGLLQAGRIAVGELTGLARFDFVPEKWRAPVAFGLRVWLASIITLYICFYLQLDQPYWAGAVVWIVSQSTPGQALSKGYYRIIGTVVGSTAGLVLVALFAQTPEVFVFALGLWIGACVLVSGLLRNFRAYGTVLAGFTAAIVALGSYDNPASVFDVAVARATCTIIGISCAAVVTWIFVKSEAREQTLKRLSLVIGGVARRASLPATVSMAERMSIGRPLVAEMIALDAQIEFAAAESAQFRIHADGARSLLAHLFGAHASKRAGEAHVQRVGLPAMPGLVAIFEATLQTLAKGPQVMADDRCDEWEKEMEGLRLQLTKLSPETASLEKETVVAARFVIDRLDEILMHLGRAVHDWKIIHGRAIWKPSMRLDFHRDQRQACINGARVFLAILAAGAFWIASGWSSGSSMVIQLSAVCSLFAAMPYPGKQVLSFFYGTLLAAVVAFICDCYLLPSLSGFPMLALVLAVAMVPGGMLLLNPNTASMGLSYCVLFLTMARILNVMNYDLASLLNNELATIMGVVFGALAFLLLWPTDPQASRRYVVRRIRRGLQQISYMKPVVDSYLWQTRMFDRINRLIDPANPAVTPHKDEWFDGGLASLNLGNEVLRLRKLEGEGKMSPMVTAQVRVVLGSFKHLLSDPEEARKAIQVAKRKLDEIPVSTDPEQLRAGFRARGAIEEMEAFFVEHPRFLTPD